MDRVRPTQSWSTRGTIPDESDRRVLLVWAGVVVALAGDLSSTAIGLATGFAELNPVAAAAFGAAGVVGLGLLKLPALALGALGWRLLPDPYALVAPGSLLVPWTAATLWNLLVLVA